MATGALDANGIWQYGEDDSETTFSGLLNKLGGSTSTTVTRLEELSGLTAAQYKTHRNNLKVGLVNIVPTSVSQTGGSGSGNALGVYSFTGANYITLNGVFTTAFKHYVVKYELQASAASYVDMRFHNNGTAAPNTYTAGGWSYYPGGGSATWSGVNMGEFNLGATLSDSVRHNSGTINIANVMVAVPTTVHYQSTGFVPGTGQTGYIVAGIHDTAATYSGLYLQVRSGTMTGSIAIYGMNE